MIRRISGCKYREAGTLMFPPDHVHPVRAMATSPSSSLRDARISNHAQQQQQQQRKQRENSGSLNSLPTDAAPKKKGYSGGLRSAVQNSSLRLSTSSPGEPIKFGTVDSSDITIPHARSSFSSDFPQLSEAPASTLQSVTASLDGAQRDNVSKLEPNASVLPGEGKIAMVQDTNPQIMPNSPSHQQQRGAKGPFSRRRGAPATQSPSSYHSHFPSLSDSSAGANGGSSMKGSSSGRAEQVQTRVPEEPVYLKQALGVDSPTAVQRSSNRNRQNVYQERGKGADWKGGEARNGDSKHGQRGQGRNSEQEIAKSIDTLGRALTRILRHQALELNLEMSSDGYVDVQDILKLGMKTASGRPLSSHSIVDVKQAVQQDKKQRFGITDKNGQLFIRANQGHSMKAVKSENLLKLIVSADEVPVCVHGTFFRHLDSIRKEGLKSMQRNHVHFASGVPGSEDVISGMKSTCEVLIFLNVEMALAAGMKLYISENKVILTEGFGGVVPPEYFKEVRRTDRQPSHLNHPKGFE